MLPTASLRERERFHFFPYDGAATNRDPRGDPPVGGAPLSAGHAHSGVQPPVALAEFRAGRKERLFFAGPAMDASPGLVGPMALKFAQGAGGALDDGGPPSPFLMGGVPSSPSPDDKGRSAGVGGATAGGVGPLLPTAQPAGADGVVPGPGRPLVRAPAGSRRPRTNSARGPTREARRPTTFAVSCWAPRRCLFHRACTTGGGLHHVQGPDVVGRRQRRPPRRRPSERIRSGSPAKGLDLKRTDHLSGEWTHHCRA
ncbi:hypothetical protein MRX96_046945 [Rhipicephalus microplus]